MGGGAFSPTVCPGWSIMGERMNIDKLGMNKTEIVYRDEVLQPSLPLSQAAVPSQFGEEGSAPSRSRVPVSLWNWACESADKTEGKLQWLVPVEAKVVKYDPRALLSNVGPAAEWPEHGR